MLPLPNFQPSRFSSGGVSAPAVLNFIDGSERFQFGTNQATPITDTYTTAAGADGVIFTVVLQGLFDDVTLTIDGGAAKLIDRVSYVEGTEPATNRTAYTFYKSAAESTALTVVLDVNPRLEKNTTYMHAHSISGPVRSWIKHHHLIEGFTNTTSTLMPYTLDYSADDLLVSWGGTSNNMDNTLVPSPTLAANGFDNINSSGTKHSLFVHDPDADVTAQANTWSHASFVNRRVFSDLVLSASNEDGIAADDPMHRMVYGYDQGQVYRTHTVTGDYFGSVPAYVEVKIEENGYDIDKNWAGGAATVVVDWTALSSFTASGGRWSGTVQVPYNTAEDQFYVQSVRRSASIVEVGQARWQVGDIVIVYGQSNASYFSSIKTSGSPTDGKIGGYGMLVDTTGVTSTNVGIVPEVTGARTFVNEFQAHTGRPVKLISSAEAGVGMSGLIPGSDNMDALLECLAGDGKKVAAICVSHGEQIGFSTALDQAGIDAYAEDWDDIRTAIAAVTGQVSADIPLLFAQPGFATSATDDANWQALISMFDSFIADDATKFLSHGMADVARDDTVHYSGPGQGLQGERWAREVARQLGDLTEDPQLFTIASAAATSATTTTVTVDHGLGTDFTPTTGILGFEVSIDGFTTPVSCTGARASATTITLTHASISTSGRTLRYQYGYNPDGQITDAIVDNGPLLSPLIRPGLAVAAT